MGPALFQPLGRIGFQNPVLICSVALLETERRKKKAPRVSGASQAGQGFCALHQAPGKVVQKWCKYGLTI